MRDQDGNKEVGRSGASGRSHTGQGNRLDRLGGVNRIGRFWQTAEVTPRGETIEFMQFGDSDLRPFMILNSAEYPGLPPQEFCRRMERAGFFTLVVQRPGFGASTPAPSLDGQLRVIESFITQAGLDDIVLMSMGTSAPVGSRLALRREDISFTLLVNASFNRDATFELRPDWFARLVRQAVTSEAMARAALSWIKGNARLFGHTQLFEKWYSKHPGDLQFLRKHADEFDEVAQALFGLDVQTFRNEVLMSVDHDPFLNDERFAGENLIALSGEETTASWKQGFEAETQRLALAHEYLPSGDCFAPFLHPERLINLVDAYTGERKRLRDRLTARA